ncbi:tetratricopeptide repeat protein [Micromonospora lupini]|uniref:ATP-binding protein n=1 Tax=Micromonospora lupini TaxID=285679 RepID=UPI002254487A|nr:tetratricopeptide repeat protein [Micromonospora lupini]MCX5065224.1 tetratricopeptide repeat protein [Micromonospora lupini]
MTLLGRLKEDSGYTYRQLEQRAARRGDVLARSTIADMLRRDSLPRADTLIAFVRACAPAQDARTWLAARNRLAAATTPTFDTGSANAAAPVPRQLPAPPALFIGRADELRLLDAAVGQPDPLSRTVLISAVGGAGGIGKTSLVLQWAHMHADQFPDGQLYADLRGFGPEPTPLPVAVTLRGFLQALGVPPASVPHPVDAQSALFRSLVARRRMLVLLDNVRDTDHVIPLLPGTPTCTVLITSRHRLRGLTVTHGARTLTLDRLSETEARELLATRLGPARALQHRSALDALVRHCGGLPLALAIVAARAATHPDHPLDGLVRELRDTTVRLDALTTGELRADLRAVFSWSWRALTPQAGKVVDLLGLVPVVDISLPAVASLAGTSTPRAQELLRELEDTALVRQHAPGRFRMHDLVHLYSAQRGRNQQGGEDREAVRRLVDFYLHTACAADRLLDPRRHPLILGEPAPGCTPAVLTDASVAMSWFDAEQERVLESQRLAMQRLWFPQVWQLARTLVTFHARRRQAVEQLAVWRMGLAAAEQGASISARAMAHRYLGQAHSQNGEQEEGLRHLRLAVDRAHEAGDAAELARCHYALGVAADHAGDLRQALLHSREALAEFQDLADTVEIARALNAVGWECAQLERYEEAQDSCTRALTLFRQHGHPDGEADTLHSLGLIAHGTGQQHSALAYYRQALAVYHEVGNTRGEADCLNSLGGLHESLGQYREAHDSWQRLVVLLRVQGRAAEALQVVQRLDLLPL